MSRRAAQQAFLVAASLALWSSIDQPRALVLVLCYIAVWILVQLPAIQRGLSSLGPAPLLVLALVLCAPGIAFGYRARKQLAENEGLSGLVTHTLDRWRLSAAPAIAPPLISADRPQTFFVQTQDAKQLEMHLGQSARRLNTQSLGHGLFRVEYEPRRDGSPTPSDGVLRAILRLDGRGYQRELRAVTPLPHPRGFCLSLDGRWAATPSEETDELIVFGPEQRWLRLPVGDGPVDCAFALDGRVLVSHRYEKALWILDPRGAAPAYRFDLGTSLGRLTMSPDGANALIAATGAEPALLWLSWPELKLRARLPLAAAADHLAFGPDAGSFVIARRSDATLRRFVRDGESYTESAVLRLGRPAVTLARSRDGRHIFVATTDYRPDGKAQLGNHFVQDQILVVDTDSLRVLEQRLTARRSERQSKPGDVDQGGSPLGLYEARDGSLMVAFAGTDELSRSAPGLAEPERVDLSDTDLHVPHGLAQLGDGRWLVSSPAYAALGVLRPNLTVERVTRLAGSDAQLLKANSAALARRIGERGFYESTRSGISCQSCHVHAGSDRAAYNLGDHRLVPTLSVAGLLGTAPYLRDGSYPRIRDLDDVAQQLYRGYLRDQPGRRLTLEAFVESLPRPWVDAPRDLAAERRGYAAFLKGHCDRCHPAPAFTNLGRLPLRALFPALASALPADEVLDVPSLLSVSAEPPYLNDGRAKTLSALIEEHNPDNLHGDTRQLSVAERRDLAAFLGSL